MKNKYSSGDLSPTLFFLFLKKKINFPGKGNCHKKQNHFTFIEQKKIFFLRKKNTPSQKKKKTRMKKRSIDQLTDDILEKQLKDHISAVFSVMPNHSLSDLQKKTLHSYAPKEWNYEEFSTAFRSFDINSEYPETKIQPGVLLLAWVSAAMEDHELSNEFHWSFTTTMCLNSIKTQINESDFDEIVGSSKLVGILAGLFRYISNHDTSLHNLISIFKRPKLDIMLNHFQTSELFDAVVNVFNLLKDGKKKSRHVQKKSKKNLILVAFESQLDQSRVC